MLVEFSHERATEKKVVIEMAFTEDSDIGKDLLATALDYNLGAPIAHRVLNEEQRQYLPLFILTKKSVEATLHWQSWKQWESCAGLQVRVVLHRLADGACLHLGKSPLYKLRVSKRHRRTPLIESEHPVTSRYIEYSWPEYDGRHPQGYKDMMFLLEAWDMVPQQMLFQT